MSQDTLKRFSIARAEGYFETGVLPDGDQVIVGLQAPELVVVRFAPNGDFKDTTTLSIVDATPERSSDLVDSAMRRWMVSSGCVSSTIRVRPFFLEDRWIGVRDLPDHYQEVVDHPERFQHDRRMELEGDIFDWQQRGDFVLYWDEEYYLNSNGELESS